MTRGRRASGQTALPVAIIVDFINQGIQFFYRNYTRATLRIDAVTPISITPMPSCMSKMVMTQVGSTFRMRYIYIDLLFRKGCP